MIWCSHSIKPANIWTYLKENFKNLVISAILCQQINYYNVIMISQIFQGSKPVKKCKKMSQKKNRLFFSRKFGTSCTITGCVFHSFHNFALSNTILWISSGVFMSHLKIYGFVALCNDKYYWPIKTVINHITKIQSVLIHWGSVQLLLSHILIQAKLLLDFFFSSYIYAQ